MAIEPEDAGIGLALAHCYLFSNEYEAAVELYRKYLGKKTSPGFSYAEVIKYNFMWFAKYGFDRSPMDRVIAEVRLNMPKEYYTK